ncbi:MAG TPA: hypothetical protein VFD84_10850 [Candidatus Binatia bacterium]|nr:hypothetical protein [Candidatus Binatia bacterium]
MTTTRLLGSLLLLGTILLARPHGASAERLARCRRTCGAAIADCIRTSPLRPRRAKAVCRKRLYKACRRFGTAACDVTPPTTTSTLPPLPPASLPPVTTTTLAAPPPTTTTLPAVRDYSGTWHFVGTLAQDSCGASHSLGDTFYVAQSGTAVSCTIGSVPSFVMYGTATADGFDAAGSFFDSGCSVAVAVAAKNDGTVVLSAATGFDIACPAGSCRSIWVGTLSR